MSRHDLGGLRARTGRSAGLERGGAGADYVRMKLIPGRTIPFAGAAAS
jgi:hypothetical protein